MQQYLLQDLQLGIIVQLKGREGAIQALLNATGEAMVHDKESPRTDEYYRTLQEFASVHKVELEAFFDAEGLLDDD